MSDAPREISKRNQRMVRFSVPVLHPLQTNSEYEGRGVSSVPLLYEYNHGSKTDPNIQVSPVYISIEECLRACGEAITRSPLLDVCFRIVAILRKCGVVCQPRYGLMGKWALRLTHTEYKNCKPVLVKMKMLLHLDGYIHSLGATPVVDHELFRNGLNEGTALSLLRASVKVLSGANPRRFRYRVPVPKTVRSRNFEANLEFNKAFSREPDLQGPDFIVEDVKTSSKEVLREVLEEPSPGLLRRVMTYEVNLTKSQMYKGSFIPKPGAATEAEYEIARPLIRKFHFWRDKIVPLLEEVQSERKARAYEYESELQHIRFIELQFRYDRFLWYLVSHDFSRDPPYVRIRKADKSGGLKPLNLPSEINSLVDYILRDKDTNGISIIADYMYKGVKIPPLSTLLDDSRVGSTPNLYINRGSRHYAIIVQFLDLVKKSLSGELSDSEAVGKVVPTNLDSAVSAIEKRQEDLVFHDEFPEMEFPLELFLEFRRLLRIKLSGPVQIAKCGCSLEDILVKEYPESSHSHLGDFVGEVSSDSKSPFAVSSRDRYYLDLFNPDKK